MIKLLLMLPLTASCEAGNWSYHIGAGIGQNDFESRQTDFDTQMLTAGLTYSPGVVARHDESLDALRRLEIATVTGRVQPLPVQDDESEEAEEEFTEIFTEKPETMEDAWIYLIWAVAIAIVALTVGALHKMGVNFPFISRRNGKS